MYLGFVDGPEVDAERLTFAARGNPPSSGADLESARSAEQPPEVSALLGEERGDSVAGSRDSPSPPAGYAFVSRVQEMTAAPMERSRAEPARVHWRTGWLGAPAAADELAAAAGNAGRGWTFGWIRIAEDSTAADAASQLAGYGAALLGSAGRLARVRVPGGLDALRAIARLPAVEALGAMPSERKLDPLLAESAAASAPGESLRVFVTLMAGDPDGRWGRALAHIGAEVGRFDPAVRVYAARIPADRLAELAAADFVQSVEAVDVVRAMHDTAVPAMGADLLRTYAGPPGRYLGVAGAGVPVGVMDTGLNARHVDILGGRASICGVNFAQGNGGGEADDLWFDQDGHGTHVTGTITGAGLGERRYAGMAPAVEHIRFAKVLNSLGYGFEDWILAGMDYLAENSGCGGGDAPMLAKPLVVNMSLGACSLEFEGRTTGERKLDATVWGARQLYVVANANSGRSCFTDVGAAKNSLAVGAIRDDGRIADFSSRGPTADGRLLPKLSATGVGLHSARGRGSRSGYDQLSGTSMASPTVAGIAALLMDAAPEHGSMPALARARLMASAIRPDVWLESNSAFPATNTDGPGPVQAAYGLGKASAPLSVLQRDEPDGWTTGGAVATLEDGRYGHVDITVPQGASRLDLVMTWDEPPAETIAAPVLNDLDLWLDHAADCGAAACGERSSRSRIDNIEWIVVRNPQPGSYRVKVTGPRVYAVPPRAALAWTVIRGKSTPQVSVGVSKRPLGRSRTRIAATLATDGYVATGARLGVGCRAAA
ncbi:MAG: S8 family serine peptidase, partial [Gammaproteobacteria bacterium]|nr:S8 family serine peptidase [Gammaproteobacteria bacterium]